MKLARRVFVAVTFLGVPVVSLLAQDAVPAEVDVVIPAVRGEGRNGSFFKTDLWLWGNGPVINAFLTFNAADQEGGFGGIPVTVVGPVAYVPDVLAGYFFEERVSGFLRVQGIGVGATARIYTDSPCGGTAGFALSGLPVGASLRSAPAPGLSPSTAYGLYMVGLLPQPGSRVNVAVLNTSENVASGVVEILEPDGLPPDGGPTTVPFVIPPISSHQFNDVLSDIRARLPVPGMLMARVRLDPDSQGAVLAYAVVNDNVINDGYVIIGSIGSPVLPSLPSARAASVRSPDRARSAD